MPNSISRTLWITALLLIAVQNIGAQSLLQKYRSVPQAQKMWAVMHLRHAGEMYRISVECLDYAASQLGHYPLDSTSCGGTADAFRHVYWMARLAQKYRQRTCISLGRAYERSNRKTFRQQRRHGQFLYDRASQEMDLRNNLIGAELGRSMRTADKMEVDDAVKKLIVTGQLYIIAISPDGNFVATDGSTVAPADVPKCWDNGKTLTMSAAVPQ